MTVKQKTYKPCKECDKKRYANTSWCYAHYKDHEKRKKQAKIMARIERKSKTKGFIENTKKKLHKQAWALMSQWVRRKDANLDGFNECYTCGVVKQWKELQAGHFKHDRLDFDERNLKPQCSRCNHYYSGKLDVYAENLIRDYGLEWLQQLLRDSNEYQPYQISELAKIIRDLKTKISQLD